MNTDHQHKELVSTARLTGVWYLALAITGMIGFLFLTKSNSHSNKEKHEEDNMSLLYHFLWTHLIGINSIVAYGIIQITFQLC
jgi:hypothetical protein